MKLNIAFLWHLHQPYYFDPEEGNFLLPWVRLHSTKNYLFIPEFLKGFPQIKHNVNLVPSLLKQIKQYSEENLTDICYLVSEKNPYEMSDEEKEFILKNFFSAHAETMIFKYPRYRELYERWKSASGDVHKALKYFGISELTDLQVLFNLIWINPMHYKDRKNIQKIRDKGRFFGEEDKKVILEYHKEIVGNVIDRYREIAEGGIVELTVSPFYHPILPILIDSNTAGQADTSADLPDFRITFPEDAAHQVREGREYFRDIFGFYPHGMWPSEGSVCEKSLDLIASEGFNYTFTDEFILYKSIEDKFFRENDGLPDKPEVLYQPYRFKNTNLHIFFRDHYLSDLIGFVYKKWDPEAAAGHLIGKFSEIRNKLMKRGLNPDNFIVSVIFDGENPWEYYNNYGIDFLRNLFEKLSVAEDLNVTTYGEYMKRHSDIPFPVLKSIEPGSWIDGTFRIWFGHQEDYSAWRYIFKLKEYINNNNNIKPNALTNALSYIHIAEGSDWFWWYGDEHFTVNLLEFDRLFRKNIKRAYKELNIDPPDDLEEEIFSSERLVSVIEEVDLTLKVKSLISPTIDGIITTYYEWIGSAKVAKSPLYGSMHRAVYGIIRTLHVGYDRNNFYLRIDFMEDLLFEKPNVSIKLNINGVNFDFQIDVDEKYLEQTLPDEFDGEVISVFDKILEVSVSLKALKDVNDGTLHFYVIALRGDIFEERWPETSVFIMEFKEDDPEKEEWLI